MHRQNPGFKLVTIIAATILILFVSLTFNQTAIAQSIPQSNLSLQDIAKYYSGLPHQNRALSLLEKQLKQINPSPLAADSIVGNIWRNSNSFSGHVDVLSRIPLADRTGANPLALAIKRTTWERDGSRPLNIELLSGPEDQVIVTIEIGNLQNDSVSGVRDRLDTKRNSNGQWEIVKAGQQFLCHRGHSGGEVGWAASLCI